MEQGGGAGRRTIGARAGDRRRGLRILHRARGIVSVLLALGYHTWSKEERAAEKAEPLEERDDADGYQPSRRAFPDRSIRDAAAAAAAPSSD